MGSRLLCPHCRKPFIAELAVNGKAAPSPLSQEPIAHGSLGESANNQIQQVQQTHIEEQNEPPPVQMLRPPPLPQDPQGLAIFVLKENQTLGPLYEEELLPMLISRALSLSDLAWQEGQTGWSPLRGLLRGSLPKVEFLERTGNQDLRAIYEQLIAGDENRRAAQQKAHQAHSDQQAERIKQLTDRLEQEREGVEIVARQKAIGFPWLARAYQEYFEHQDALNAQLLEQKKRPAIAEAKRLVEVSRERRRAESEARVLRYQLLYYESLFPWLKDFRDEQLDDQLLLVDLGVDDADAGQDPAKNWLSPAEFSKLNDAEKYQLALDRYWASKKSPREVGRLYERYVGYLLEKDGYQVEYHGIVEGFADLGRDLIGKRKDQTAVVQCKCWKHERIIHEKHINQLFGTVAKYQMDLRKSTGLPLRQIRKSVSAQFYTSCSLSDAATEFATDLGVKVVQQLPLERYPCIKCNVSQSTNELIYHLPFDQQYDRVVIEPHRGECYATTVKEAEALGFRRAKRWLGNAGATP